MQEVTGTRDLTYDLISVLYHALQAAETCMKYEKDAREEGKPELAAFFKQVIAAHRKIAEDAKFQLKDRLAQLPPAPRAKSEKAIDEASKESFPASDPPATY